MYEHHKISKTVIFFILFLRFQVQPHTGECFSIRGKGASGDYFWVDMHGIALLKVWQHNIHIYSEVRLIGFKEASSKV